MKFTICLYMMTILLSCSPAVKKTKSSEKWSAKMANSVIERFDSLGYYNNRTRIGWSYDIAMLGMSIDKLGSMDEKYSKYLSDYMDYLVKEDGSIPRYDLKKYNLDMINPARNLILLYKRTNNEKYHKALGQFITQIENHPKTKTGGFWHKRIYPYQMWLDGIYMASPFLAQYAKEFNEPKWFDVVTQQITLIYSKTLDTKTGLLYHAWDESKQQKWSNPQTGQSPHFWSRSMGWYVLAIVDVLDYLPEDHPKREEIIKILQNTCDALMKVQDKESGVWHQVLDQGNREGNYLEGSGTAMYTYAFAKGAKKGYLDKKYLETANEVFDHMLNTFIKKDENGLISMVNICGSCGLGGKPYRDGSYKYYITEKVVTNDCKGIAPFIMAAVELDR